MTRKKVTIASSICVHRILWKHNGGEDVCVTWCWWGCLPSLPPAGIYTRRPMQRSACNRLVVSRKIYCSSAGLLDILDIGDVSEISSSLCQCFQVFWKDHQKRQLKKYIRTHRSDKKWVLKRGNRYFLFLPLLCIIYGGKVIEMSRLDLKTDQKCNS